MQRLKNKHEGETVYIVGKGPSLQYLNKEDIGEGIVISINQSIDIVESLGLENIIYSQQKDGCINGSHVVGSMLPDCALSGKECGLWDSKRPKGAILLLHDLESKYCFPDYPNRHVFNLQELGLPENVFSLIFAIKIAQYMGCNKFKFVCCDAHAKGDYRYYSNGEILGDAHSEQLYQSQRLQIKPFIKGLDCEWITPGDKKKDDLKISFGCISDHPARVDMALRQSEIEGTAHIVNNPISATKGLNELLARMENEGNDVAILVHHDMSFRRTWLAQIRSQLALLPDNWIVAGIIGKDMNGNICGKMHDTRIPAIFETSNMHYFPYPASCFDECCIIVNLHKGFRFDETLEGFDLYGTMCVLQTWEMGGTAWILDSGAYTVNVDTSYGNVKIDFALALHHCTRNFHWFPDEAFSKRFAWLHRRFPGYKIDTTVLAEIREMEEVRE